MKKFLFLAIFAFSVWSCLDSGSFSESYTAKITFEYPEDTYSKEFKDSIYVLKEGEGFAYYYPIVFGQHHTSGRFNGGFLMSYLKGEADGALEKEPMANDIYRVHASSGADNSKTYVVFYDNPNTSMMPKVDVEFVYKTAGTCVPSMCQVNNTTHVARKVEEHFVDGDKLVLKATGWREGGQKTSTSIVLAEYSHAADTVMYNWTDFDLSKLGVVDYIDFEVSSTNPAVPGYCCLDGFIAAVQVGY